MSKKKFLGISVMLLLGMVSIPSVLYAQDLQDLNFRRRFIGHWEGKMTRPVLYYERTYFVELDITDVSLNGVTFEIKEHFESASGEEFWVGEGIWDYGSNDVRFLPTQDYQVTLFEHFDGTDYDWAGERIDGKTIGKSMKYTIGRFRFFDWANQPGSVVVFELLGYRIEYYDKKGRFITEEKFNEYVSCDLNPVKK